MNFFEMFFSQTTHTHVCHPKMKKRKKKLKWKKWYMSRHAFNHTVRKENWGVSQSILIGWSCG
jgi:hypothetical protein